MTRVFTLATAAALLTASAVCASDRSDGFFSNFRVRSNPVRVAQHQAPAPMPLPTPDPLYQPMPGPMVAPVPLHTPGPLPVAPAPAIGTVMPAGLPLYPHVKYEDRDNAHPCGVKKIVAVLDPTPPCDPCRRGHACGSCAPCARGCVFVEICVPPCGPCEFKRKRKDGSKVEFDYGKYEIEIKSKDGLIIVDYDD